MMPFIYMMMTVLTRRRLEIASRRARVASRRVPTQVQVNGIMMFIFGMQMMVQAQYNVRGPASASPRNRKRNEPRPRLIHTSRLDVLEPRKRRVPRRSSATR